MLTPITRSSFSPIQVSIRSSNGTDLTPSIQVLHSHIPLSTLQQRSYTSTPIKECWGDGTYISSSSCQRARSPQAFETSCAESTPLGFTAPPHETLISKGTCAVDEICVGSNTGDENIPHHAYCVSTNDFVQIEDASSGASVTAGFNSALHSKSGSQLAVEAVITSLNKGSSLMAKSMVMQAQAYNGVWRTVNGGHTFCLRCSSVTLAPFPETAQRVKVDVVLQEWLPAGLLWLASYSY